MKDAIGRPPHLAQAKSTKSGRPVWGTVLRQAIVAIGLVALGSSTAGFAATAQDAGRRDRPAVMATAPIPPVRPDSLSAPGFPPPVAPSDAPPPGVNPMVADFAPDMPQILPQASRAQMHKCGAEWQKMKASGAAADKTWFAFAQVCLVK